MIVFLQAGKESLLRQIDQGIDHLERQINITLSVLHFGYAGITLEQWRQDLKDDLAMIKNDRKRLSNESGVKELSEFLFRVKGETKLVIEQINFCIRHED